MSDLTTALRGEDSHTLEGHLARFGDLPLRPGLGSVIRATGLRGRGGAAYPAAEKLERVREGGGGRPVVVANGAEGEPASFKDKALLRHAPHLVLDGLRAAAHEVGARNGIVALSADATTELAVVRQAIAERRQWDSFGVVALTVPEGFVSGEETALLRALGGGPSKPAVKPPYPAQRGLDGKPTLVQNVETLAHMALIARVGTKAPATTLVTLSGAVARPGVYEIELGTSLSDLVAHAGGLSEPVSAFLVGGYFGRWVPGTAAAETTLTPDVLGAGAVVAFPAAACGVAECVRVSRYLATQSAGQCGPCTNGLPAIAGAMEGVLHGHDVRPRILRWAGQVNGRGACGHPDGAARFVESSLEVFAPEFDGHTQGRGCSLEIRRVLRLPERQR
jgi:NADH:ubiquinone oxidoreductase subunit F (NADH-binding)